MQVLVDADNVDPVRTRLVLAELAGRAYDLVVAGHPRALARTAWPDDATVTTAQGWQRADMLLAEAYRPGPDPLVLVSGDGDFGLLVTNHDGPVLVVSEAASYRLRGQVSVVDPVVEGVEPLRQWFAAVAVD